MTYRIIISQNGKKKKVVHKSNDLTFINRKYFSIKDKNNVLFSKKTTSYLKTKPVKYELILMKKWDSKDIAFLDRDPLGRIIEVEDVNKKWTILYKNEYHYEETFKVFGYPKRLESKEIIKNIILKKNKGIIIKQLNYLNNKLLIHQDTNLDIILCKCPDDAKRLYKIIEEFYKYNKINNIMFTGAVGDQNKKEVYKIIVEKTGWSKNKIYRTVTRP